jgi:hypothetical protein
LTGVDTGTHHCNIIRTSGGTETNCSISSSGGFVNDIGAETVGDVTFFEPREGHLTTPTYSFEPGQYSFGFRLEVVADLLAAGPPEEAVFHNSFDHTFSFAREGPVANLPDGWNFHGPNVVNNRFAGDVASPVPEPSTVLLSLTGLLLIARRLRRCGRLDSRARSSREQSRPSETNRRRGALADILTRAPASP